MMFGALGISIGSRATAGAARPRDKPVMAAKPAPTCSKLRRVVDFVRGEAFPPPAWALSLSSISPRLSGDPLLRANLPIYPPSREPRGPSGPLFFWSRRLSILIDDLLATVPELRRSVRHQAADSRTWNLLP